MFIGSKYDKRHQKIVNASKQVKLLKSVAQLSNSSFTLTSSKENIGIQDLKEFIIESSKSMELYSQDPDKGINIKEFSVNDKKDFCTLL